MLEELRNAFFKPQKPFIYIFYLFFRIMDTADLRQYLSFPPRGSAVEVMRDAVETHVLGAVWLLELVLSVRVNRKTRRQLRDVADAFASPRPPRWFGVLQTQLWNQYRLLLIQGHFIEKNDVKKLIIIYMFLKEFFFIKADASASSDFIFHIITMIWRIEMLNHFIVLTYN